MSDVLFGLFGTGGCARGIMPFARSFLQRRFEDTKIVYVETKPQAEEIHGIPVMSEEAFLDSPIKDRFFNIGIADSRIRESLADKCLAAGCAALDLIAPDVVIYDGVMSEGAILCARTMITANVKIGKFFHGNIYSYVEHDCVIGDYVTFAPRVSCNGNIHIGDHAYIGAGAIIKQGKPGKPLVIGEGAVIGMGAVVTKDVAPHTIVTGNPARVFVKNNL